MATIHRLILIALCICFVQCVVQAQEPPPTPQQEGTVVGVVEFRGNTVVSSDELLDAVGIEPGQTVTPAQLSEAVLRIRQAYAEHGYIGDVTFYELLGEQPSRTLVFNILETKITQVQITGLQQTRESIIRRVIIVQPGDVYNQEAIRRDVFRLNQLGIFEEIQVALQETSAPGEVVVVFDFREAKTQRIDLGGTYSPEGRLVAQVQYTQANLFGRAQRLSAAVNLGSIEGRIGGQIAYFNPLLGRPNITLFARAFSDVAFRFSRDLVNEPDAGRYFERSTGLQAVIERPTGPGNRISYGLRYDNTNVQDLPLDFFVPTDLSADAVVISPSASYVRDHRLFLGIPVSGSYSSSSIEPMFVDFETGGSDVAGKLQAERRWYFPLRRIDPEMLASERRIPVHNVAVRLSAGTSAGDLPFFRQYFVGGVFDLRGYRESRFWGKNFFTLNTELRWPLSREFIGMAFVDVGDAWDSDFQFQPGVDTDYGQHNSFSPRAGAGVGIWYVSEFGIIRLEYARGEDSRVHFAVGESF